MRLPLTSSTSMIYLFRKTRVICGIYSVRSIRFFLAHQGSLLLITSRMLSHLSILHEIIINVGTILGRQVSLLLIIPVQTAILLVGPFRKL